MMLTIKKLILISIAIVLSAGQLLSQTDFKTGRSFRIIFSLGSFHTAKSHDAKAVSQILINHLKEAEKRTEDLLIIVADGEKEILEQAKIGFDLIVLTSQEYYDLKKLLPLEPAIINQTDGKVGYKYLFLVHKNEGINTVAQLKGETINILARDGQNGPILWMDDLLKEKKLSKKEKFFQEIKYDFKLTNVLLPLFFKKVKAALITDHGFKLISELNPQINEDLNIIAESAPIAIGLGCINALEKDPDRINFVTRLVFNLHKTNYGKQILDFFATDQIVPFKPEYMKEFLRLMEK